MDDLTPLDISMMLNHNDVTLLLLNHGAQENPRCEFSDILTYTEFQIQ